MVQEFGKRWVVVGMVSAALAGACSRDRSERTIPTGRGSATCQAWQQSICNYLVFDCKLVSRGQCVDNYFGVTCKSDAVAQSCAAAFNSASCDVPPTGCDLTDIADPQPAVSACNSYVSAMCQHQAACGKETLDGCMAQTRSAIDCTKAIGYAKTYETCMKDMATLSCSASGLPPSCGDVIKLIQSA